MGKTIPMYESGQELRGIVGVNANYPKGIYALKIVATDETDKTHEMERSITVGSGLFKAEKISFGPSKKEKLFSNKIQTDQDEIMGVLTGESETQLWNNKFIMPIKGYVTSGFGSYRLYNGKSLGNHRGLDIGGNPIGTKIKAANSGVVAFTKFLPTIGSTIVLDHGQGVYTIYMHMSKTLVKAGETVSKGDVIGLVGNTGLSNGAHLHWGLSIHGVRVNPLDGMKVL